MQCAHKERAHTQTHMYAHTSPILKLANSRLLVILCRKRQRWKE